MAERPTDTPFDDLPHPAEAFGGTSSTSNGHAHDVLCTSEMPGDLAEAFLTVHPSMVRKDGVWWLRRDGRHEALDDDDLMALSVQFLEHARVPRADKKGNMRAVPVRATPSKAGAMLSTLIGFAPLLGRGDPCWIVERDGDPDPERLLPCADGVLDIDTGRRIDTGDRLFTSERSEVVLADEETPERWLEFLHELWPGDEDSIRLFRQWCGYFLTGDTSRQTIFALLGPPRAGKGTITKILARLLGPGRVGHPRLSALDGTFATSSLVGKRLAIFEDARLGTTTDAPKVADLLLSISGEDPVRIERKYRDPYDDQLRCKLLLISNELPWLQDMSGALAARFSLLRLCTSFAGRERSNRYRDFLPELCGIMRWALGGLADLERLDRFTEPESARELSEDLAALSSPIREFVAEKCVVAPHAKIKREDLWAAWIAWCQHTKHREGTRSSFGRALRSAVPDLHSERPFRPDGTRERLYLGVQLG
jgi:putative DNA primase/helicase